MTIELKDLTTYNGKYVCRVHWPPEILDSGHYKISGVIDSFLLVKLLSDLAGCHFRVEGYKLCRLLRLSGSPFAGEDEGGYITLIFNDCILD